MKRIICSSARLLRPSPACPSRVLFARSFGSSSSIVPSSISHKLSVPPPAIASSVVCRYYAKKTVNSEVVSSDKQKKNEMIRLIDEEINVLSSTLDDSDSASLKWEVADRFLKETQFKLEEDTDAGRVRLTKTAGDKTITVTFSSKPEEPQFVPSDTEESDDDLEEEDEDDVDEDEKSKKSKKGSRAMDEADEDMDEEDPEYDGEELKREQPFTVEIKSNRPGKDDVRVFLNCYSNSDGSFIVSELNTGDNKRIPVNVGDWSDELQQEMISWLEPFGVNERLSFFIHQYLDRHQQEDNIKILKDMRQFMGM